MQRGRTLTILTLLALLCTFAVSAPSYAQSSSEAVSIKDFKFNPSALTVAAGTTVVWKNEDSAPHTVTAADGSWTSDTLNNGDSFQQTFDTPGTFTYYCKFHGNADGTGMAATITVTEAAAAPAPASDVTPMIAASDQPIKNTMVSVSKVVAAQDGWVVIHKNGPDGKLLVSPIVGKTQVKAGESSNVMVELTESFQAGDQLYAMLHIDAGTAGTYEFPDGPDTPVQAGGNVVLAPFKVQAADAAPGNLPTTGGSMQPWVWLGALALLLVGAGVFMALRRRAA